VRFTTYTKLLIISLLFLIIPSVCIGTFGYYASKHALDESGATGLKNNVKMAIAMIDSLNAAVKAGQLSLEEAQEQVKTHLLGPKNADGTRPINKNFDLGKNGYFFVIDKNGLELAHPKLEGKNVWDLKSADGFPFMQAIAKAGMSGGGYTYYNYKLPDSEEVAPKIAYSEMDPNWGWIVSAGSYKQDFNSKAKDILYILVITLAICLTFGICAALLFARHLSGPIKRMSEQVKRVSSGDLTVEPVRVKNRDEIGMLAEDFNQMTAQLKSMIARVAASAQHVAATSEQLTASAEETSKATDQIAGSIQEISSGAETQVASATNATSIVSDIARGLDGIAAEMQSVSQSSFSASELSQNGNEVVKKAILQMNLIHEKVKQSADVVNTLGHKSSEIGQIVSLITDIASQTNLLALNAAIEAARAGEQGRGFAVVADEVRKLAEQSGTAAGQISQLIQEIQVGTRKAVDAMDGGTAAVAEGMTMVNDAGAAFTDILKAVESVSKQTQEVSAAIQQIHHGAKTMVDSIEEISRVTDQSSAHAQSVAAATEEQLASMEEITAGAQALAKMAQELQDTVNTFKL
jgi:methyl-accepting chemotaxis protein